MPSIGLGLEIQGGTRHDRRAVEVLLLSHGHRSPSPGRQATYLIAPNNMGEREALGQQEMMATWPKGPNPLGICVSCS
ncbi:hypothetical protein TREES_T100008737 [Tupaia chinensis]|uniref:Uncharacterized protein n=1 Tax=Tupaia chinensis TaxID=246437 RepID=L9L1J5_TUPCH|nr:hypothetical protein TREES_T100008737 [Tupaia chinensis]